MRAPLLLFVSLCGVVAQKGKGKGCSGGLGGFDRDPCGNIVYSDTYLNLGSNCKFCLLQLAAPCVLCFHRCDYIHYSSHVLLLPGFVTLIGRTSFPPCSRAPYSHGVFEHENSQQPAEDFSDKVPNEVTDQDTFQSPIMGTVPPFE
jgi:hypothetical protein